MNITARAKTILCYGDSNTYGQMSESKDRWDVDTRWTAQLQRKLGDNYYIIEEGLNSRTTDLEYYAKPGRNGKAYLQPCLESHNPIDMVIIMLGTNDLKTVFDRTPDQIAEAVRGLIHDVQNFGKSRDGKIKNSNIYLLSPILIDDTKELFHQLYDQHYNMLSVERSHQLALAYSRVAQEEGVTFLDAAAIASPGADGIHLSKESHGLLSSELAILIEAHFNPYMA